MKHEDSFDIRKKLLKSLELVVDSEVLGTKHPVTYIGNPRIRNTLNFFVII